MITPHMYLENIFALPFEELKAKGINGIILDLDNTITEWHSPVVSQGAAGFIKKLKALGMKACLLSNNSKKRVRKMASQLGIDYVHQAKKPLRKGFRNAFALLGTSPSETAIIGDQLFTDIFGGRRAGIYTILVKPMSAKEMWGTRYISRRVEKLVWGRVVINMNAPSLLDEDKNPEQDQSIKL